MYHSIMALLLILLLNWGIASAPAQEPAPASRESVSAAADGSPKGPADKPDSQWGETANGLRMRISIDKNSVALKEKLRLTLEVERVAKVPIWVRAPNVEVEIGIVGRYKIACEGCDTTISARLLDSDGRTKLPEKIGTIYQKDEINPIKVFAKDSYRLEPGHRLRVEMETTLRYQVDRAMRKTPLDPKVVYHTLPDPTHIVFRPHSAGRYELEAVYKIDDKSMNGGEIGLKWTGTLKSNPIWLEVKEEPAAHSDHGTNGKKE